jgi:hypothetical protein
MNTTPHFTETNTTVFIMGAIFNIIASMAWDNLFENLTKAVIGGIIWLCFKLIGDYISHKYIERRKRRK